MLQLHRFFCPCDLCCLVQEATAFETTFFGYVSSLYAVLLGNTLGILYSRQQAISDLLYKEVR